MKKLLLVLCLALCGDAVAQTRPAEVRGPAGSPVHKITGSACTQSGDTLTCTAGAGGTGSPGGVSGNIQKNDGLGGFGVYTGTSCAYAVKTLDSNGAASCTAAPTIPSDISGLHYVTTQAEAGLSAEAVLPACTGTQKLTFQGGTISCAADADTVYSLPAATASVLGGVKGTGSALVCSGTDKATGFASDGTLQCAADSDTVYSLPAATATTLGGVKAPSCGAGNHYSSVDGVGALVCSADSGGGGGAPTTATYITQTPDATLSAEQALSALSTGLLKSTTSTGVLSIYGGASCTNQFPRSLDASGAPTCASVSLTADVSGILPLANGGTNANITASNGQAAYSTASALALTTGGTTGQYLSFNSGAAPTWSSTGLPTLKRVSSSNFTTTATTASTVTNLSFSLASSTVYYLQCSLAVTGSATGGPRVLTNFSSTTSALAFTVTNHTTSATTLLYTAQNTTAGTLTAACTASCLTTQIPVNINGVIVPTGAGTLAIQAANSTSGQTTTVFVGSACLLWQVP